MISSAAGISRLRFVRCAEEEGEGRRIMAEAIKALQQKGVEPVWVEDGEVPVERGCVYVLEAFNSSSYKALSGKARLIGPQVVLAHLKHNWPLPTSMEPVFTMAMHGVVACFTQAGNRDKRVLLTQQVRLMGGRVERDFTKRVTHLIAGNVGTTKYHVARSLKLPVLLPQWVESCWKESVTSSMSATDDVILSQHRCLPFTGCTITVTGLDEGARQRVKEACQMNGGNYFGELTKGVCTHLLVGNKASAKYKFALQWKMYCVSPSWFDDSLASGYCMPEDDYSVEEGVVTKGKGQGRLTNQKTLPEWVEYLETFRIPDIKGEEFLDGCKLFLCGFSEEQLEKLIRVINKGGGVRYGVMSDAVTHVVVGDRGGGPKDEVDSGLLCSRKEIKRRKILDTQGDDTTSKLLPSAYKLHPPASKFLPSAKEKGESLTSAPKRPRPPSDSDLEEEDDIMGQYAALPPNHSEDDLPLSSGILKGCGVMVSPLFPEEDRPVAMTVVRRSGGEVVTHPHDAIYILAPLDGAWPKQEGAVPEDITAISVTMVWLRRCIEVKALLDPASYFLFQPMTTPISSSTLTGCVIAFSQFTDLEREHLIRFSKGLGAIVQDHFARYPAHGLLSTTHLILKNPTGDKFFSAKKWNIPAVADSWLFECATTQRIVPVDAHLIALRDPDLRPPNNPTSGGTELLRPALSSAGAIGEETMETSKSNELSPSKGTVQNPISKLDQLSPNSASSDSESSFTDQHHEMTSDPSEAVRQLQQHLDELREAPQEQQLRRQSRRLREKDSDHQPHPPTRRKGRGRRARQREGVREKHLLDSQVSDSQLMQVTYDDPEGRREKERVLARIKREEDLLAQGINPKDDISEAPRVKGDLETPRVGGDLLKLELPSLTTEDAGKEMIPKASTIGSSSKAGETADALNRRGVPPDTPPPPIAVPIVTHSTRKPADAQPLYDEKSRLTRAQKPRFLLSSLDQREKIDYGALIQELGGEYIDQDYFTTKCTHLVVGKASRTEKYLGACAAGKWILHKSYLEECRSSKCFVLEEGHEWGGRGEGGPLEVAPRIWRLELEKQKKEERATRKRVGAFVGWRVLVFAEKVKLPGLKRLLEAGGATVVGNHTHSGIKGVTHAFITLSHFPKELFSLGDLSQQGTHCLRPDYIAEYLSRGGKDVNIEPYLLNEVRHHSK